MRPVLDIDSDTAREWDQLIHRAADLRPFLVRSFVEAAARHLTDDGEPFMVAVSDRSLPEGGKLLALAVLVEQPPNRRVPVRHVAGYKTRYTYRSGIALRSGAGIEVLPFLLEYLAERGWGALTLESMVLGDGVWRQLVAAAPFGVVHLEGGPAKVPVLYPSTSTMDSGGHPHAKARLREHRRRLRRLGDVGPVEWRVTREVHALDQAARRLLELEHMGWKGEAGSSMRSNAAHEYFFLDLVRRGADRGNVFFTEMCCDGTVIASLSHLVAGREACGFKLGWDPNFSRFGVGLLQEHLLIERAPTELAWLDRIDGGTVPGTFMDRVWVERIEVSDVAVALTRYGALAIGGARALRTMRSRLSKASPAPNDQPAD